MQLLPDVRNSLHPHRLNIAMWCFSWLHCHHPGGSFEDFDKCTDELLERGFNCIRIECFPWIIGRQKDGEEITIAANPHANWGQSPADFKHRVDRELIELLTICKQKGIFVILATWGFGCVEYPPALESDNREALDLRHHVWDKTLDLVKDANLSDIIAYVDLDQEFPHFSPIKESFKEASNWVVKESSNDPTTAMVEAGLKVDRDQFSEKQKSILKGYMAEGLEHFQYRYPELRFTYSFTNFVEDIRALGNLGYDVLELHFWIHGKKFDNRTGFPALPKDRDPQRAYADYQDRVHKTLKSVGPMLRMERESKLKFGVSWAEEISVPLVTTEAWGPWWHMDHPDLQWDWLRDWCEEGMMRASAYKLWGTTPWNYAHPYWENWHRDLEWYQRVNQRFLTS
ncbi:MAG: cellulase-like family protein [Puniceicoccaceae bacterium]